MPVDRHIVYESENIRLIAQEQGGDDVVVSFNHMGLVCNEDQFWWDGVFESQGITAFGFMTPRPNWYPADEMVAAIAIANRLIAGRRVITMGNCQGGYGALKFGRSLSASISLGFSPQWSINPADVKEFDTRFHRFYKPALKNGFRIEETDLGSRNFVFYDPSDTADAWNARRLAEIGAGLVIAPFTRRDCVRVIREGRAEPGLIDLVRAGGDVRADELRGIVRSARAASGAYRMAKTNWLLPRAKAHPDFLERHLQSLPDDPLKILTQSVRTAYSGDLAEAGRILTNLSDDDLIKVDFGPFCNVFREAGFRDGELRIARLIPAKYGSNHQLRFRAVQAFMHYGQQRDAIDELSNIIKLPGAHEIIEPIVSTALNIEVEPELVDGLLNEVINVKGVPKDKKFELQFRIANYYIVGSRRSQAFQLLQRLAELNDISANDQISIADRCLRIGEANLALDLFRAVFKSRPGDLRLEFRCLEALLWVRRMEGLDGMAELVEKKQLPPDMLENIARVFNNNRMFHEAINVASKALSAGSDELKCRNMFVTALFGLIMVKSPFDVLINIIRKRKITNEIKKILLLDAEINHLRSFGDIADQIGRKKLAMQIAEIQWNKDRADPVGFMHLAEQLVKRGARARLSSLVDEWLETLNRGATMSANSFVRLVEICLTEVQSLRVEMKVLEIGLDRFPSDERLLRAKSSFASRARLVRGNLLSTG